MAVRRGASAGCRNCTNWEVLWKQLDSAGGEVVSETRVQIVVSASTAVTTAVSVGYVIWTVRGTALVASLASSLPTWTLRGSATRFWSNPNRAGIRSKRPPTRIRCKL